MKQTFLMHSWALQNKVFEICRLDSPYILIPTGSYVLNIQYKLMNLLIL